MTLEKIKSKTTYEGTCWRFKGATNKGYGVVRWKGKNIALARLSLHLFKDFDLASSKDSCHILECKYRDCWNPEHLYVGTRSDNEQDAKKLGKIHGIGNISKTHCHKGHEYTLENTYTYRNARACKICRRLKDKKRRSNSNAPKSW